MGQTNELELEGEHHQHVDTLLAACLDPPLCSCTGHILQLRSQLTCAPSDSASRPALLPFRRAARRVHGAVLRRRLAGRQRDRVRAHRLPEGDALAAVVRPGVMEWATGWASKLGRCIGRCCCWCLLHKE